MQKKPIERITLKTIQTTLLEQFHLEKGIGYTIKQLLFQPRAAIQEYLYEDRLRMIKPSRFVLLTVAIATFISYQFLPLGDELLKELHNDPQYDQIPELFRPGIDQLAIWMKKYFNLVFMSSLPLTSLASFWVFKEANYNYAEHLVLNSYLFCIQTILYILSTPFITNFEWIAYLQAILTIFYFFYFFTQVFQLSFWNGIGKSVLVGIISQVLLAIILLLLFAFMTFVA